MPIWDLDIDKEVLLPCWKYPQHVDSVYFRKCITPLPKSTVAIIKYTLIQFARSEITFQRGPQRFFSSEIPLINRWTIPPSLGNILRWIIARFWESIHGRICWRCYQAYVDRTIRRQFNHVFEAWYRERLFTDGWGWLFHYTTKQRHTWKGMHTPSRSRTFALGANFNFVAQRTKLWQICRWKGRKWKSASSSITILPVGS